MFCYKQMNLHLTLLFYNIIVLFTALTAHDIILTKDVDVKITDQFGTSITEDKFPNVLRKFKRCSSFYIALDIASTEFVPSHSVYCVSIFLIHIYFEIYFIK